MFNSIFSLHKNVWLLMFAQSLIGSIGPIIVFVGGFIGIELAPTPMLATLPVAFMVIGVASFLLPTVNVISRIGRKKGFAIAIGLGVLNSAFAAYTITQNSFWLFCLSILLFGITIGAAQQFRFAAMESVSTEKSSLAVSIFLIAGLLAAFIGPEVAFRGKDLFATQFVGSFVCLSVLLTLSLVFIAFYQQIEVTHEKQHEEPRPLKVILRQPVLIASIISATIGFAVMSFIMTATPISMHVHSGFAMEDTKWVIQSHIIAMYLPSFFTGHIIQKFGKPRVLFAGISILLICIAIGFIGQQYSHYWLSLVLLGVGWNFMFVTATTMLPEGYRPAEKFKVQGFNDFFIFSVQALASLSAGWVITTFGWSIMLSVCIPFLFIATLAILRWQRTIQVQ